MKLRLLLNIGSIDAQRLDLKATKAGDEIDVEDSVASVLLENGWATVLNRPDIHRLNPGPGLGSGDEPAPAVTATPGAPSLSSVDLPPDRGGPRTHLPAAMEEQGVTPQDLKAVPTGSTVPSSDPESKSKAKSEPTPDLANMNKAQLIEFAKARGIEIPSGATRDQVVEAIEDHLTR